MPVRVAIADDHPIVRRGLRALLDTLNGVEVVAEADSGESAVALVAEHNPDVVLMDLHMPGIGGLEATRRICDGQSSTAVLVLTMLEDDESVRAALKAGARGYLLKGADQDEIERALHAVAADSVIFSPGIGSRVLGLIHDGKDTPRLPDLTPREYAILELLAEGIRTSAIAEQLYLSPKTVSNALTSIFTKLGVTSRAEAIVIAQRNGMGSAS